MKNTLIITFVTLLFACQSQTYNHPESTLDDFNSKQLISSNIKSIKEYWRVPSTNRDSLIEPIGLMLVRESHFNKNGQLRETRCIDCAVQFHGEPPNVDLIRTLEYKNKLLTKYLVYEFDTTSFEVKYFNGKSLTKGFKDNRQGYTSIEYYDSIGRILEKLEFEFYNAYPVEQQIHQIFLRKEVYEYGLEVIYKQSFRTPSNSINLTIEQFTTLKSEDLDKISELFRHFDLDSSGTEVITLSKSGNIINRQMHNVLYPDETEYEYDESGLLSKKVNKYNGHEIISEYYYDKR